MTASACFGSWPPADGALSLALFCLSFLVGFAVALVAARVGYAK